MSYSIQEENLFCAAPFTQLAVWYGGGCQVCSYLKNKFTTVLGFLKHYSPSEYFNEIWNGAIIQELRAAILDGSFKHCDHSICLYYASRDKRYIAHRDDDQQLKNILPNYEEIFRNNSTQMESWPRILDLAFDCRCNLGCPQCRDFRFIPKREQRAELDYQNLKASGFLEAAESIRVGSSGELFASPLYRDLMFNLDPAEFPQLKQLNIISNGTLFTKKNWARLSQIHHLIRAGILEISIDAGTAETYAINRKGGDFYKLLNNLEFITTLNIPVKYLNMVVQANNYREIPLVHALAKKYGFTLVLVSLENWGTISAKTYAGKAVFMSTHPQFNDFIEVIRHLPADCFIHSNLIFLKRSIT